MKNPQLIAKMTEVDDLKVAAIIFAGLVGKKEVDHQTLKATAMIAISILGTLKTEVAAHHRNSSSEVENLRNRH